MREPSFVHKFKNSREEHTFKGSLTRHKAVERVLYLYCDLLFDVIGETFPLFSLLEIPLQISFGLNCNFPPRDVIRYVVWALRGYTP